MAADSRDYDVAVIGGGNAALCAALTAREAGARVVVIESAPREFRGGNSRHTRNLRCAHGAPTSVLTDAYLEDEFLADLLRVNGFDESFQGWGYEDSDFAVRLVNAGVGLAKGAFATGVLHLWHREHDRAREGENWERLQSRIVSHETRAELGLDQYALGSVVPAPAFAGAGTQ